MIEKGDNKLLLLSLFMPELLLILSPLNHSKSVNNIKEI